MLPKNESANYDTYMHIKNLSLGEILFLSSNDHYDTPDFALCGSAYDFVRNTVSLIKLRKSVVRPSHLIHSPGRF